MIEAMPSNNKNTANMSVSDTTPDKGQPRSMNPATMASTAENNDHQNPGAVRMRKVLIKPTTPLNNTTQPMTIAAAMLATAGSSSAAIPRMMRMMPSLRNSPQCSCSEVTTAA